MVGPPTKAAFRRNEGQPRGRGEEPGCEAVAELEAPAPHAESNDSLDLDVQIKSVRERFGPEMTA